jgi:hypothetical protein
MKNLGTLLLGVWLIASGLKAVADLSFRYEGLILGVLAIVSGILIVLRR